MNDYFEREILAVEDELSQLKTAAQRSSGTVETTSKTVAVSVPLSMNAARTTCSGSVAYLITCEHNAAVMATLDWYYGNVADNWRTPRATRRARVSTKMQPDGKILATVTCNGTSVVDSGTSDLARLKNGESVSISVNLTVRATDNFTIGAV